MKYVIVAYDRNRAIGAQNDIPWIGKMKSDMQHVRDKTAGNAIIMGRKTYDSIGRALPNRQNIVVTSGQIDNPAVTVVRSIDEAYDVVEPGRDAYIFGGGQIYGAALDTVDEIIATEIDTAIDKADAFFPVLGPQWQQISREHHDADADNIYAFDFVTYRKSGF